MHRALNQFEQNIARVRALGGLYQALATLTTSAVDATDILRAQIVMAVSALDHYVHELTLLGMMEVYAGSRPKLPEYVQFVDKTVPSATTGGSAGFEVVVREKHSFQTFQQPVKVAAAVRLFSPCELWPTVARTMGRAQNDVEAQLRLIVDRRNKIVHEADIDPSYPGMRWPVSPGDASDVTDFVDEVCCSIHSSVV